MSSPFVAEIRCFGFDFAPRGWALCNGQILPISQNTAVFSLLGTQFGGNGTSNFALPNLQGNVPIGQGQGPGLSVRVMGETAGEQTVTLLLVELPAHSHQFFGTSSAANVKRPVAGSAYAQSTTSGSVSPGDAFYAADSNSLTAINPNTVQSMGQSLPHNNLQPFVTMNWCIALQGVFPARN
jgi:microcystin-dependent protein